MATSRAMEIVGTGTGTGTGSGSGTGIGTGSGSGDDGLCCAPLTETVLSEAEAGELAPVLAALGDPIRLRLLSIVASQGEVCSCNLEEPLGRSQPTISHHTRVLAEAGLIVGDKRGRWTWWSLVPGRLTTIRQVLGG